MRSSDIGYRNLLSSMSGAERSRLARSLEPRTNRFIPTSFVNPETGVRNVKQQLFCLLDDVLEVLYGGAAGGGKLLDVDTPILTPQGFTTIFDILPGDFVFGLDGKAHLVEAESRVQYVDGWRLTFDDGSTVVAHDDHLWLTYCISELAALSRRTPEFRARRRANRPSRAVANPGHGLLHQATVIERNRTDNPSKPLPPPTGTIRTTQEIVDTLEINGRTNHAIPVAAPLQLPHRDLPLDPYLLGCWLGDGTAKEGHVTSMDPEIIQAFVDAGFGIRSVNTKPNNLASTYLFDLSLKRTLENLGVIGNKHIPASYLYTSEPQRLALLQGLMDTDGGVEGSSVAFTSTNRDLAEGVAFLFRSLGMKATLREFRTKVNGKDCGPGWRLKIAANRIVFRLDRKASVQKIASRRTTKFRYIKHAERVEGVLMKCLKVSAPDSLFLATEHLIPTHNSEGLLRAASQYLDVPGYSALIIRRTYRDLALPGALMHRSHQWWDGNKEAAWDGEGKVWRFSTGSSLQFGYMEHAGDEKRFQSAEFQAIFWDELTQLSLEQYTYMFSRLRRLLGSNVPIRMRAASNPGGPGHLWVKKRWNLPEGLKDNPNRLFIPAFLEDNPFLDHGLYEQSLTELSTVTFEQLRKGNWDAESVGGFFEPDELMVIDRSELPHRTNLLGTVRHWDLAATKPTDDNPDPDWTVGLKLSKWKRLSDGMMERFSAAGVQLPPPPYWVIEHVARDRRDPGGVEELVRATASLDGRGVVQSFEQERGASGKTVVAHYRSNVLDGHRVMKLIPSGDKATRAKPPAARMREGKVFVLAGDWNEAFLDELRVFGLKDVHDDQVDGLSGGYEQLRVLEVMSGDDQVEEF